MNRLWLPVVLAMGAAAANAQNPFPDEVTNSQGVGCSYSNVTGTQSPGGGADVGCWADASCANGRLIDVNFYQHWSCQPPNNVTANGDSDFDTTIAWDYILNDWRVYNAEVRAEGTASVKIFSNGTWQTTGYSGYDTWDCVFSADEVVRDTTIPADPAVFAEFERESLRERVKAGIAQALKQGKSHGRPRSAARKQAQVIALFTDGHSKADIARRLRIGRSSVQRILSAVTKGGAGIRNLC